MFYFIEVVVIVLIILAIQFLSVYIYMRLIKSNVKHAPAVEPPHQGPTEEQKRRAGEIQKSIDKMMSYDMATAMKRKGQGNS